jgi:hypothetical protein
MPTGSMSFDTKTAYKKSRFPQVQEFHALPTSHAGGAVLNPTSGTLRWGRIGLATIGTIGVRAMHWQVDVITDRFNVAIAPANKPTRGVDTAEYIPLTANIHWQNAVLGWRIKSHAKIVVVESRAPRFIIAAVPAGLIVGDLKESFPDEICVRRSVCDVLNPHFTALKTDAGIFLGP